MTARPDCDGTTYAGAATCTRTAVWQVTDSDGAWLYSACAHHLHQIATDRLKGEQGVLTIRRIQTEGC